MVYINISCEKISQRRVYCGLSTIKLNYSWIFNNMCIFFYFVDSNVELVKRKVSLVPKQERFKNYIKDVNIKLRIGQVVGTLKRGNEHSNSIKYGEFLD